MKQKKESLFFRINHYLQRDILEYAISDYLDLLRLRRVCKYFRQFIDENEDLLLRILKLHNLYDPKK